MNKKTTYSEKLKDPRWQKKRLEILERDNWMCQCCGYDTKTLHVHHRVYLSGREPWDIPNELLVTLCVDCHETETEEIGGFCDQLGHSVKEKFFAYEIKRLAEAFNSLTLPHCSEVFSSVIKYWLSTPEKSKQMLDEYFDYLSSKSKEPF